MSSTISVKDCLSLRQFFNTGATRPYAFRKSQLQKLKAVLLEHENEIYDALHKDLKKSPEESYATELGLVLAEISYTLRHLRQWMLPLETGTDLVNLPSTSSIYRDPKGVVLIISPWNYPLQLLLIPLVGAIAGGNVAVLKPSEFSLHVSALLEKIIEKTFPGEYVKLVSGDGASIIPALMKGFRFDHVFYTGSIPVGKSIYQLAAESLVPVTLELGGKSPCIVEADANLKVAARRIVVGKFVNAGQTCIAPDYLLVHEQVKDKLIEEIKQCLQKFYGPDPSQSRDFGKIISEKRFDKLVGYLSQGKIIYGGESDKSKLFIAPTLVEEVPLDSGLMTDEIFGPIFPVYGFREAEEAERIIALHSHPLSLYVFSASREKERQWIEKISFGGGCINNSAWHFTNYHLPFGGIGDSGIGAYHGKHSFDLFTHAKAVMKTPNWWDPSIKYPPFRGKLKLFKLFFK